MAATPNNRTAKAHVLPDAPRFPTWAHPVTRIANGHLYVCFEDHSDGWFSVVVFKELIEHRIQNITDESLSTHPFFKAGLSPYEFHVMEYSPAISENKTVADRHWVVTFKDVSLDVIAKSLVFRLPLHQGVSPDQALDECICTSALHLT